jgi:hypothetical protein
MMRVRGILIAAATVLLSLAAAADPIDVSESA